jgi:hypothetical protein
LTALLTRQSKPIVVVDPFQAGITANLIADQIKSNRVHEMPIFWHVYASALMDLNHRAGDLDEIQMAYDRIGNAVL